MKINIYYGGRGLFDDPTLFVLNLMEKVFRELGVTTERFNLYEMKNRISTLPQSLKEADGIILASTVEWFGVGGYMQQFLDACYLYGDKEKIARTYMCPVVMSTTYGEREGKLHLSSAWEILGGLPCSGLCGYIADMADLEMNKAYHRIIEKKAEDAYRTISRHAAMLPASNQAVRQKIAQVRNFRYTPQENEQIAQYASDQEYVEAQKADIQELTSMFRGMMKEAPQESDHAGYEQSRWNSVSGDDFSADGRASATGMSGAGFSDMSQPDGRTRGASAGRQTDTAANLRGAYSPYGERPVDGGAVAGRAGNGKAAESRAAGARAAYGQAADGRTSEQRGGDGRSGGSAVNGKDAGRGSGGKKSENLSPYAKKLEKELQKVYLAISGFKTSVRMHIEDEGTWDLIANSQGAWLSPESGSLIPAVEIRLDKDALEKILEGKVTFLKSFMVGEMKMTGDFQALRNLDQVFRF